MGGVDGTKLSTAEGRWVEEELSKTGAEAKQPMTVLHWQTLLKTMRGSHLEVSMSVCLSVLTVVPCRLVGHPGQFREVLQETLVRLRNTSTIGGNNSARDRIDSTPGVYNNPIINANATLELVIFFGPPPPPNAPLPGYSPSTHPLPM